MDKRVDGVPSTSYIKVESPIERRLYTALVLHGYPVRAQVKGGPYRIDLVIGKLAIECDGKAYHSFRKQKAYDQKKDLYLTKQGYEVVRIRGRSITQRMPHVLERVKTKIYRSNR